MDDIVNSVPSWMFTAIIAVCILFIIGIIFARLGSIVALRQSKLLFVLV